VQDRRAIDKPTRVEEINRNRFVFAVEIKHSMLTWESISKGQLAEVFTANFRVKFVLFSFT
jgi:hypothetical protein